MADQNGLREFVAVVKYGSFTAAAEALNVSTSFISREVKRLEERIGTRLLHRTTRSLQLTDMGETYHARGLEISKMLDALESDMAELQHHPKGNIRITAAGLYAERYVAPALAEFTKQYPDVSVELNTSMSVVDIVEEGFDVAIRMAALEDSSLIARKIAPRRVMVCASPGYLNKHGHPNTPDDLKNHNCLCFPDMVWRFQYPDGMQTMKVEGTWCSDNGRALVAAAIRGMGLVRMTDYYMVDGLRRGELVPVLEEYEVQDAATWIVFPTREQMPTRIRILIDFLAERLKQAEQLIEHTKPISN
ncbi:MAG: LysR family transcriptional activator of dmlA [Cryomorphaceae bacterium]|jgi:LysR family transcriptional activator of dmlA